MLNLVRSVSYFPVVKWKAGERKAFSSLGRAGHSRVTPLFLMPPSGDFDHETGRRLTPLEHIKLFGKRLYEARGRRLAFVDAVAIDDEEHRRGLTDHPLTELLGRAEAANALACPATAFGRSPGYQEAVERFAARQSHLPICLRVNPLDDMESGTFAADLRSLIVRLGCEPNRVVLVLDFASLGELKLHEIDSFAEVVAERVYFALELSPWLKVVTAFTSFPTAPKMKPGDVKLFPRTDWLTYRRLVDREPYLLDRIAFGDYAVDSAPFSRSTGRATASAQFRYTTPRDYLIVKGQQAKKPVGYGAIYPVARTLAERDEFMGAKFSEGDGFVSSLAAQGSPAPTGNASTWRWVGTDHHLARVLRDIAELVGHDRADEAAPSEADAEATLF